MQQPTSRQLYAYWDGIRNGRIAPRRFEIEPAKIAPLLPETFIAECRGLLGFRFRLAGTKICQHFGRELRGIDFLSLWAGNDRDALASLVRTVLTDGAVGHGTFRAYSQTRREASFELTLMPLIHTGQTVNRLLGAITAIEPPFWLGAEPLTALEVAELHLHWPDGVPAFMAGGGADIVRLARRRFRVVHGGLSND
ncbi:MAG: PAS domain-containing protein [Methyloceanibacter sp.]|uniref:PAS domain-containing protein n=1 Tax=Methyloceanibacter sp. TaxID=1965321 RepID=UPI003D6D3BB9